MTGYQILGAHSAAVPRRHDQDPTFGIYGLDGKEVAAPKPISLWWYVIGGALVLGGLYALSQRAASPAALRRRALLAGLSATPAGCRTEPWTLPTSVSAPSPYYRSDFAEARDMGSPSDMVAVVDLATLSPDLAEAICCDTSDSVGCFRVTDGGLIPIGTDGGTHEPWCPPHSLPDMALDVCQCKTDERNYYRNADGGYTPIDLGDAGTGHYPWCPAGC